MKTPKKRASVTGELVGVRVQPDMAKQLDDWRRQQDDLPGRPEAMRRLLEQALSGVLSHIPATSKDTATRAAELAAKTIDKKIDSKAPAQERAVRKRKLLQGPSDFRESRKDRAK
jgi:hypothetical protein